MNLQILKGDPTPEELAALVTVLAARPTTEPPAETGRASNWATYWRNARQPFHPGPGQWRASAHP
ncbi:acyl-CoA carboxylase subunit epsilon [Kribbella sp. NPDC020789]